MSILSTFFVTVTVLNKYLFVMSNRNLLERVFMPLLRDGEFRFAFVCLSENFNFVTKIENWGHACSMDTFLVV